MKSLSGYQHIYLPVCISMYKCARREVQSNLHTSALTLTLTCAGLREEPSEASVKRTSSSASGEVHHVNATPSAENLKRVKAPTVPPDWLESCRYIGSTPSCLCFDELIMGGLQQNLFAFLFLCVKFTDSRKTAEIFLICCCSWRWNSNQELMEMSHPGFGFWQPESSFTTIVPVSSEQRCCLWSM